MSEKVGLIVIAVVLAVVGGLNYFKDAAVVNVSDGEVRVVEPNAPVGGTIGSDIYQDVSFQGQTAVTQWVVDDQPGVDYTLQAFESGSMVYATSVAATTTLPAAKAGLNFHFFVDEAIAAGNWVIDSAEGDNIYGTLSVNNADVACSAEDQINFVTDGETIGDNVKLVSDGTNWFIASSDVETAAKMTCTDPN